MIFLKNYYHGSCTSGITQLEARSRLHNTKAQIVYLTDSIPYALFYIWDAEHNGCSSKHVTGWTRNDIAYYEEQFPDQLKTFYQGVSGYLYRVSGSSDIKAVADRTNMFYCTSDARVAEAIFIPDVYEELLKYEAAGSFVVLRYNERSAERQNELVDFMAQAIIRENFYMDNEQKQAFIKKHFYEAWEKAELQNNKQ
jgi:hypothetical protein